MITPVTSDGSWLRSVVRLNDIHGEVLREAYGLSKVGSGDQECIGGNISSQTHMTTLLFLTE